MRIQDGWGANATLILDERFVAAHMRGHSTMVLSAPGHSTAAGSGPRSRERPP